MTVGFPWNVVGEEGQGEEKKPLQYCASYPNIAKSLHAPRMPGTQDSHDQPTMCFHHLKDTHPVTREESHSPSSGFGEGKKKKNNSCKHKRVWAR